MTADDTQWNESHTLPYSGAEMRMAGVSPRVTKGKHRISHMFWDEPGNLNPCSWTAPVVFFLCVWGGGEFKVGWGLYLKCITHIRYTYMCITHIRYTYMCIIYIRYNPLPPTPPPSIAYFTVPIRIPPPPPTPKFTSLQEPRIFICLL